jgi:flagellin
MATSDLTRIRSNIQGLNMLRTLRDINNQVATHQLRLGTGQRINSAGDDPAGLSISTKLDNSNRILQAVYDNIGQAKNWLAVGEGGLMSINDILVGLGEKIVAASNDTLGSDERKAISVQLVSMVNEISDIAKQTGLGSTSLLSKEGTLTFQTGPTDSTTFQTHDYSPSALGLTNLAKLTESDTIDATNYQTYLDEVNKAISAVSTGLTSIGSLENRLDIKAGNISTTQTNTEAAYSRIRDADMAKEQLELTKNQILQQTTTAMLAQANTNSQSILTLFK